MEYLYAIIIPDANLGSNEPYEECTDLSHALACLYALHDTAWGRTAYLAQRTPDGRWETRLEARDRREDNTRNG